MEGFQEIKSHYNSKINILWVSALFVIFIPSSFNTTVNSISLYLLMPLLFLGSFARNPRLIFYKPLVYLLIILIWSILTMIKSTNMELSNREIRQLLGVFLLSFIIVNFCFINKNYVYVFYVLFVIKFLFYIYYAYNNGLGSTFERFNLPGELNANLFGYYGFFAVISSFFIWQSANTKPVYRGLLLFLFILCILLSLISCFYAASRAGIFMTLLMSASLFIIYFFYPFKRKSIWGILLIILIGIIAVPVLNHYYANSILERRMQIEVLQGSTRIYLIKRALEIGFKNPLFGVGPGNFSQYSMGEGFSHCSYTELFANNGFPALLLFLFMLLYFVHRSIRLYMQENAVHKHVLYFYCFIVLYAVYNLFYVFYLSAFLMGFFFLVLAHMEMFVEHKYMIDEDSLN